MAAAKPIDVAVLGRVGIDLYPNQLRTPLREVRTYTRFVGGFAGNVATGIARLGLTPAIVSRVGPDPHGEFVRDFLSGEGVDVRFLAVDERLMTPPTFCEVWPPDRFPITFYRYPTVPDWQLAPEDFDGGEVAAAPFLLATGTGLAQSPSRETTLAALAEHHGTTIFDLDWRPTLWEQADEYGELARTAVGHADIVIGNEEEVEAAAGDPSTLLELGVRTLVLKRGERGALLFHEGREVDVAGRPPRTTSWCWTATRASSRPANASSTATRGYVVLALIAERVEPHAFPRAGRATRAPARRIDGHSVPALGRAPRPDRPRLRRGRRRVEEQRPPSPVRGSGDGGIYSTAADISSFWLLGGSSPVGSSPRAGSRRWFGRAATRRNT